MNMTHSNLLYRLDISRFYLYVPLLLQIFVPWKFIKAISCLLLLLLSTATQITISVIIFVSNIIKYEINFLLKYMLIRFFIIFIIWFKCKPPLLLFLIRTIAYRKALHRNKLFFCRLYRNIILRNGFSVIELHVVH